MNDGVLRLKSLQYLDPFFEYKAVYLYSSKKGHSLSTVGFDANIRTFARTWFIFWPCVFSEEIGLFETSEFPLCRANSFLLLQNMSISLTIT